MIANRKRMDQHMAILKLCFLRFTVWQDRFTQFLIQK